jgi:hypothetical protein
MSEPAADRRPGWMKAKHAKGHGEDGLCLCDHLTATLAAGTVRTIDTVTGLDGKPHPIPDQESARRVKNRAYHCGGKCGVRPVMSEDGLGLVELGPGRWGFRYRAVAPDEARAHVDQLRAQGQPLAYDATTTPKLRERRRGRRQTERELMAERLPLQNVIRQAIHGGLIPSPDQVPHPAPAPFGFCDGCGARLSDDDLRRGTRRCTGCEVSVELIHGRMSQLAKPAPKPRPRPAASTEDSGKARTGAGKALADFWASIT